MGLILLKLPEIKEPDFKDGDDDESECEEGYFKVTLKTGRRFLVWLDDIQKIRELKTGTEIICGGEPTKFKIKESFDQVTDVLAQFYRVVECQRRI